MRPMVLASFFSELEKISQEDEGISVGDAPKLEPGANDSAWWKWVIGGAVGVGMWKGGKGKWKKFTQKRAQKAIDSGKYADDAALTRKLEGVAAGEGKVMDEALIQVQHASGGKARETFKYIAETPKPGAPTATWDKFLGEVAEEGAGFERALSMRQWEGLSPTVRTQVLENPKLKGLIPKISMGADETAEAFVKRWEATAVKEGGAPLPISDKAWAALPEDAQQAAAVRFGGHANRSSFLPKSVNEALSKKMAAPMNEAQSATFLDDFSSKVDASKKGAGIEGGMPMPEMTATQFNRLHHTTQARFKRQYPESMPEGVKVKGKGWTPTHTTAALGTGAGLGLTAAAGILMSGDKPKADPAAADVKAKVDKPKADPAGGGDTGTTTTGTTTTGTTGTTGTAAGGGGANPYGAIGSFKIKPHQGLGSVWKGIPQEARTKMVEAGWTPRMLRGYIASVAPKEDPTKRGGRWLRSKADYGAIIGGIKAGDVTPASQKAWSTLGGQIRKKWGVFKASRPPTSAQVSEMEGRAKDLTATGAKIRALNPDAKPVVTPVVKSDKPGTRRDATAFLSTQGRFKDTQQDFLREKALAKAKVDRGDLKK